MWLSISEEKKQRTLYQSSHPVREPQSSLQELRLETVTSYTAGVPRKENQASSAGKQGTGPDPGRSEFSPSWAAVRTQVWTEKIFCVPPFPEEDVALVYPCPSAYPKTQWGTHPVLFMLAFYASKARISIVQLNCFVTLCFLFPSMATCTRNVFVQFPSPYCCSMNAMFPPEDTKVQSCVSV